MKAINLARLGVVFTVIALCPRPAHAYLDPSTGGMLISALISIAVTTGLAVQAYWYKLVGFFRRGSAPSEEASTSSSPGECPTPERKDAV